MHLRNQSQCFAICADEYVQSVIERDAVDLDAARAATEGSAGFIHGDGHVPLCQRDGRSHTGVAATDDRDPLGWVRHADDFYK